MRQPVWTVEKVTPPALMSAGLALMLVAGALAWSVPEPRGPGGANGGLDAARDPRVAAKLMAANQAFPMVNGCTYPYPYPYTSCPEADLVLTKDADRAEVELEAERAAEARRIAGAAVRPAGVSKPIEYDVFVKNMGPDPASNVIMVDSLPPGVVVDEVTTDGVNVTCQVVPPGPGQPTTAIVCTQPTLAVTTSFEVFIGVRYIEPSNAPASVGGIRPAEATVGLVNTATVTSDESDPSPANNTDTAATVVYTPNTFLTLPSNLGYWLAAADGGVFSFGNARFFGSMGGIKLNRPIVGTAATRSGNGYWLVASDGGIFAFGDAVFRGSTGGLSLAKPIVGMTATPTGNGYWLVASDGGIFAFGDAVFHGSTGNLSLNKPIVAMAPTPSGQGYWMFASDGGVFAFGDATFLGGLGSVSLNKPIVGASASGTGTNLGYYMVASDGGIFSFGNAPFLGSASVSGAGSIVAMAALPAQPGGYWLAGADGGVFSFGDAAKFLGGLGGTPLAQPIVAFASRVPAVP